MLQAPPFSLPPDSDLAAKFSNAVLDCARQVKLKKAPILIIITPVKC